MKINGASDSHRLDQALGGNATRATSAASPASGPEKVALSSLSEKLASLESRLATEGEFDQARVDEIKAAIANGEYRVNAQAVADKLIQDVQALLSGKA